MSVKGRIEIKNLNKTFARADSGGTLCAIASLYLTVEPGEFVSIVGASGCGKSTLLRIIAGLETPTQGEVSCDGLKIDGTSPDRGLVFQEHTLFPWLTVRKNIVFALKASGRYEAYKDNIDAFLEKAGLSDFADSFPHQLSGGMRQRAALVRSLAVSPEVLLLDEPLGALDSFTRMTLQDEIIRLWNERGNTMLLITHDVDEAVYLSQRIIVMSPRPGRIIDVIDVPMSYPRNRGASDFENLRIQLLRQLNFASDVQQDYYL
jgi:ABC-type nitrate/sulfonate/bicarbonate transport system ATPase subunit